MRPPEGPAGPERDEASADALQERVRAVIGRLPARILRDRAGRFMTPELTRTDARGGTRA